MNSNELLDAFKAHVGAVSDYALAREVLKINPVSLLQIRERGLSDERAVQMAQALKLNVGEVLATIRAERSKDPAVRRAWAKIAKTLRASAAAAVLAVFLPFPTAQATTEGAACILRQIRRRAALAWILAALALCSAPARAAEPFSERDLAYQWTYTALHVLDWGQTLHIAEHPERFEEKNPILGAHPSRGEVNRYFAATLAAQWLIARYVFDGKARRYWQGAGIVIEAGFVAHNAHIGVRVDF